MSVWGWLYLGVAVVAVTKAYPVIMRSILIREDDDPESLEVALASFLSLVAGLAWLLVLVGWVVTYYPRQVYRARKSVRP